MQIDSRRSVLLFTVFAPLAVCTSRNTRAGETRVASAPNDHQTQWIPFSMPDGRHIVVDAIFSGFKAEAVLDSAVGKLVLAQSFADNLGLETRGAVTGIGVTGQARGDIVQAPSISIGHVTLRPSEATAFDLDGLSAVVGRPIVAIIGRDLFDNFIVDIDFVQKRIGVEKLHSVVPNSGETIIPLLREAAGNRVIPISIEGQKSIPAIFDLGSDTPLYVSPAYAQQHELLSGIRSSTSLSAGVEGQELNTVAVMHEVRIGHSVLRDVPIEVPRKWDRGIPAVVGLPILERFNLRVDFSANQLALAPIPAVFNTEFRKDRSGIGASRDGDQLRVIHVAPGSPAASAGLKVGDVIVAINGMHLDAAYFMSRPHEGSGHAGKKFRLTLANGSIIEFVLTDYY
jgi:hypothetical protein